MRKLPKNFYQEGQTLLIILLILAVILTVGLSTISSSITDIKITKQTEEATRAFYVAESALEERLILPLQAQPLETGSIGGIGYEVAKTGLGGEEFLFPFQTNSGEPQIVWLVGHDEQGQITLSEKYNGPVTFYWGNQDTSEKPALMVSYIYTEGGAYKISRYNFDPDAGRRSSNNFDPASTGSYPIGGKILKYSASIPNLPRGGGIQPYFLKLTLIYNSSPQFLGVKATSSPYLPTQGFCFTSTATVAESGITRKIKQCKLWENLPNIFYWGLYSGGNLEK